MSGSDFTGRKVLVTGASRGIGLGVAEGFLEAGAELTILSSGSAIEGVARDLSEKYGRHVDGLVCDITDREAVAASVGGMERIDVLVNNAGLELITPIDAEGREVEETFRRIIDINVMGTYYVTREA
ncbi:MAG: SDR family NAD(P)-dependent oxidoreductase, partial [Alphaproteobacteria bacterium]|nr:SDR family NAD(P)-dependent oxidoreductase [Alphaproteobacteria bacterium]